MDKNRIPTTLRIELKMLRKIDYIAEINKRSTNAQIEFLIQKCVEEFEKEKGVIKFNPEK